MYFLIVFRTWKNCPLKRMFWSIMTLLNPKNTYNFFYTDDAKFVIAKSTQLYIVRNYFRSLLYFSYWSVTIISMYFIKENHASDLWKPASGKLTRLCKRCVLENVCFCLFVFHIFGISKLRFQILISHRY